MASGFQSNYALLSKTKIRVLENSCECEAITIFAILIFPTVMEITFWNSATF